MDGNLMHSKRNKHTPACRVDLKLDDHVPPPLTSTCPNICHQNPKSTDTSASATQLARKDGDLHVRRSARERRDHGRLSPVPLLPRQRQGSAGRFRRPAREREQLPPLLDVHGLRVEQRHRDRQEVPQREEKEEAGRTGTGSGLPRVHNPMRLQRKRAFRPQEVLAAVDHNERAAAQQLCLSHLPGKILDPSKLHARLGRQGNPGWTPPRGEHSPVVLFELLPPGRDSRIQDHGRMANHGRSNMGVVALENLTFLSFYFLLGPNRVRRGRVSAVHRWPPPPGKSPPPHCRSRF